MTKIEKLTKKVELQAIELEEVTALVISLAIQIAEAGLAPPRRGIIAEIDDKYEARCGLLITKFLRNLKE